MRGIVRFFVGCALAAAALSASLPAAAQVDPEQERQERRAASEARRYARLREQMGVTDDAEWQALLPRVVTVQNLSRLVRDVRDPERALRGPRPPRGADGAEQQIPLPLVELSDRARDLRVVWENPAARPPEIQHALAAFKASRDKADEYLSAELAKARQALRELVTARQELALFVAGVLD